MGVAKGLFDLGHSVSCLLSDNPKMEGLAELLSKSATVHRMPYHNTYDRRLRSLSAVFARQEIAAIADKIRHLQPDIVHVNKQNLEDGLELLLASEEVEIPTVTTVHVTQSMRQLRAAGGRVRDMLAKRVLRQTHCDYLAIANHCRDDLRRVLPAERGDSIHMVWNGVHEAPPVDREVYRREWNVSAEEIVIGCAARIEAEKNPLIFPDLLTQLPQNVRLVWVGDGRLREELQQRAEERGVAERVIIDGWRSDARERMKAFDIFALPSEFEMLPFALLEAMSAALPCIATDMAGIREAVEHQKTGWLCSYNDQDQWQAGFSALVENVELRTRLGTAARRRYEEHFSLKAMATGTVDVYRKVMAKHHAAQLATEQC